MILWVPLYKIQLLTIVIIMIINIVIERQLYKS